MKALYVELDDAVLSIHAVDEDVGMRIEDRFSIVSDVPSSQVNGDVTLTVRRFWYPRAHFFSRAL